MELFRSKWKLLILRNLFSRQWRFNELRRSLEGIRQKVLTDSLRSMKEDGITTRTVYPEVPPRMEYALSELGETMQPMILSMENWGKSYKEQLGQIENPRTGLKNDAAFNCQEFADGRH